MGIDPIGVYENGETRGATAHQVFVISKLQYFLLHGLTKAGVNLTDKEVEPLIEFEMKNTCKAEIQRAKSGYPRLSYPNGVEYHLEPTDEHGPGFAGGGKVNSMSNG